MRERIGWRNSSVFFMTRARRYWPISRGWSWPWALESRTLSRSETFPAITHIREMLDAAEPALRHPVFADAMAVLERDAGRRGGRSLGSQMLIAWMFSTEYLQLQGHPLQQLSSACAARQARSI